MENVFSFKCFSGQTLMTTRQKCSNRREHTVMFGAIVEKMGWGKRKIQIQIILPVNEHITHYIDLD